MMDGTQVTTEAPADAEPTPKKPTLRWNDREVKFVEFDIRTGREFRQAFAKDRELGYWTMLKLSARYADDDQPLFASVDEIETLPFRLQQRIDRLAAAAWDLNGPPSEDRDPLP